MYYGMILIQLYGTKFKREKWLLGFSQCAEDKKNSLKSIPLCNELSVKRKEKLNLKWSYESMRFLLSSGFVKQSWIVVKVMTI